MIVVHQLSLQSLRETFEARASEWMLTGATITLSIAFWFNTRMFRQDTFDGMRQMNDNQYFWAMIFTIVGVVGFGVLIVNGAYYRTPHFRSLIAFLRAGIWFTLCVGFARNGSVLISLAPWLFFLDCYNSVRAAKEAGRSELKHRYHLMKAQQDLVNGRTSGLIG